MGMAASQARYLALVARKSNCEFEGQQINQARTALSNQSANLFNQMLGLQVPVPPSTQDFTKIQYSFTDGFNASTITKWDQIPNDPDYNHIVTHHYYADRYTGSLKQMGDPQVQLTGTATASVADLTTALNDMIAKENAMNAALPAKTQADTAYAAAALAEQAALATKQAADNAVSQAGITDTLAQVQSARDAALTAYNNKLAAYNAELLSAADLSKYDPQTETNQYTYDSVNNKYTFSTTNEFMNFTDCTDAQRKEVFDILDLLRTHNVKVPIGTNNTDLALKNINDQEWETLRAAINGSNFSSITDYSPAMQDLLNSVYYDTIASDRLAFKQDLDSNSTSGTALTFYQKSKVTPKKTAFDTSLQSYNTPGDPNCLNDLLTTYQNKEADFELLTAQSDAQNAYNIAYADLQSAQADKTAADTAYTQAVTDYNTAKTYYESLKKPEYIGNSKLTLLGTLTKDQETELKQVVADMKAQDINTDIINCFDENTGAYKGGIYSFQLNGVTYYTTHKNLMDAQSSHLTSGSDKIIDGQYKMAYYNAYYVSTKIETTEKALLETDEEGRFSSIRFENDSVKYKLNMETITDNEAYDDAMNQYIYENAKYDKMIQDINARTSIIQQQDQQLELRLKQLDTEQKALTTEMEAVKKVVNDNVESSFKTFGG